MKRNMMTVLLVLLMMVFPATVFADSAGSVTYNGTDLDAAFKSIDVSDLQPGDEQTYEITLKNDSDVEADWWLSNTVIQSLEDSTSASGGAYTYILQYNGTDIYNNTTVGGESTKGVEGLHQATNAMEEFFFLATMAADGSGTLSLTVALDGETQGNAYQNTAGEIELQFAVEPHTTPKPEPPKKDPKVQTGDSSNMMPYYIAAMAAGLMLLLLAIGRMRRTRKEGKADE